MKLNEFSKLKKKLNGMIREYAKIEGSLEHNFQELKDGFECATLEQGEEFLAILEVDEKKLGRSIATKTQEFEEQWGGILDEH